MLLRDGQGETERERESAGKRKCTCVFMEHRIVSDSQLLELITFSSVDSQGKVLLICAN